MKIAHALIASALVLAPAALFAQAPVSTVLTPGQYDHNIGQRKVDQQDRIGQGVQSGQLTRPRNRPFGAPGSRHQP